MPSIEERLSYLEAANRRLQIDDMDAMPLAADERLHLWIPAARLVSEVDTGVDQLLDCDERHVRLARVRVEK